MAEEGEGGPTYTLDTGAEVLTTSKDFDGRANATHENGDGYDGMYLAGKRNGHGTYKWKANGDTFDGGYIENKRVGLGKYTYTPLTGDEEVDAQEDRPARGGQYHGHYDGQRNGNGTFQYVNGDEYNGDWKNGKKHGNGTYRHSKDGSRFSGKWEHGAFVSGKWTLVTGMFFVGTFKWNHPWGEGVWVLPNGNQVLGAFSQTEEREEGEEEGGEELKAPKSISLAWKSKKCTAVRG